MTWEDHNTAARLITGTKRYEHINPALRDLHWLPVESQFLFWVLLITFTIIQVFCPVLLIVPPTTILPEANPHLLSLLWTLWHMVNVPFLSLHLYYGTVYRIPLKIKHLFHHLKLVSKNSCFGILFDLFHEELYLTKLKIICFNYFTY